MAVRKTELGIEYLNPEKLGELGVITQPEDNIPDPPDCYLVSYLTSPITKNSSNTYVVFLKSEELKTKVESYHWRVSIGPDIGPPLPLSVEYDPEMSTFKYEFYFSDSNVIIDVDLKDKDENVLRTLTIRQKLRKSYEALERLLKYSQVEVGGEIETHNAALGAHPETSREVLNDLYPHIKSAYESSNETNKVPFNFLAAIVYLQVFRVPKESASGISWASLSHMTSFANRFREEELENLVQVFNGNYSWSFGSDIYNSIGVTQISPQTLAMIVDDPESDPTGEICPLTADSGRVQTKDYTTYIKWTPLPADKDKRESVSDKIRDCYLKLSSDKQIRLFNLLRFPKSNIKQCFDLLNFLKNRPNRYLGLSTEDFASNKDAIKLIATEFEIGGTESTIEEAKSNKFGSSVATIMNSPIFTIGFGGEVELKVEGTVEDETSSSISMEGAKIHIYRTILDIFSKRKCFISKDKISRTPAESDYITIKGYKITDLNIPGLSNDLKDKIRPLLNKHYGIEDDFLFILKHLLGDDFDAHKNSILTKAETKMDEAGNYISCAVLDVERSFTIGGNNKYDIVKIKIDSPKLDYTEGWIISRYDDTFYAKLVSKRDDIIADVNEVDDNNKFSFSVSEYQPYFIRVVKEPVGINGYFDGEIVEEIEDLPLGWFLPPKKDIRIGLEPAKHMVNETELVGLLTDWLNYNYASTAGGWKPKFPKDSNNHWYDIRKFYSTANLSANNDIACNSFASSIVLEAWHKQYPALVSWNKTHWFMVLMAKNEWDDNEDEFNKKLDMFSTVSGYTCRTIWIKENPTGGDEITIQIDDDSVKVNSATPAGTSNAQKQAARSQTAILIKNALNANNDINKEIIARVESSPSGQSIKFKDEFVIIENIDQGELNVNIVVSCDSGNIEVSHNVFPAIPCDISAAENNKGWLIFQGWSNWSPARHATEARAANGTIGGHNVFVVSVHTPSGKVLSLESNFPNSKNLKGPGFRQMAKPNFTWSNDSGDLDYHVSNVGTLQRIDPNKEGNHWTNKVKAKWSTLQSSYNEKPDGENSIKVARLKVYNLNWTKPIL